MSDYLYKKFYGKYRIMAHLDLNTMDFPRDDKGKIETDDFYIPCKNGAMIQHYGRDILTAYIPSAIKGNKLLKMCKEEGIEVSHVIEGDGEISFRFKAKYIDFIADYLKAKTMGKDVRPFSIKNLPKSEYTIPSEDINLYRQIVDSIPKEDVLVISQITKCFLDEKMQKKYKDIDIKSDIKKKCMSRQTKEYIHSMGMWNEYLKYIKQEISNYQTNKEQEK